NAFWATVLRGSPEWSRTLTHAAPPFSFLHRPRQIFDACRTEARLSDRHRFGLLPLVPWRALQGAWVERVLPAAPRSAIATAATVWRLEPIWAAQVVGVPVAALPILALLPSVRQAAGALARRVLN